MTKFKSEDFNPIIGSITSKSIKNNPITGIMGIGASKDNFKGDDTGFKMDITKIRMDLIEDQWLIELGKVLMHGAALYGDYNWKKVESYRYKAALLRHLTSSNLIDEKSRCNKWIHVAINALFLFTLSTENKTESSPSVGLDHERLL